MNYAARDGCYRSPDGPYRSPDAVHDKPRRRRLRRRRRRLERRAPPPSEKTGPARHRAGAGPDLRRGVGALKRGRHPPAVHDAGERPAVVLRRPVSARGPRLSGQDPREVRDRIQFREAGYLTLASEKGASALRENVAIQHAGGADWIDLLDPTQLSREFPWLSVDGVGLGAFGRKNEGYFDPWGLLDALRRGAKALGVQYMSGEAASLQVDAGRVTSVLLKDGSFLNCGLVVNACGAHASVLTPSLPIAPRKRCIFAISCPEGDLERPPGDAPLVVDVSGCYFRGDGAPGRYLCGASPPEGFSDPDCDVDSLDDVDHQLFEEVIWPALYERVPAFEALRVESSWAGLYEFCTLDQNAVVGWHPDASNLVVAAGFSGHGLQHAPGVGRAVAELIDSGGYESIESLGCLDYGRVVSNEPLFEANGGDDCPPPV